MPPVQVHGTSTTDESPGSSNCADSWTLTQWSGSGGGGQQPNHQHDTNNVPAVLWPRFSNVETPVQRQQQQQPPLHHDWRDAVSECSNTNAPAAAEAASSSWQEEAHWMSFRNAVHFVAQLQQNSSQTSSLQTPVTVDTTQQQQLLVEQHEAAAASPAATTTTTTADDDDSLARFATQHLRVAALPVTSQLSSPQQHAENDIIMSTLASDLAATKMRLALAQAERDEMEFALLSTGAAVAAAAAASSSGDNDST